MIIPNNNYDELNAFYGNHGENLITIDLPYALYMGGIKITRMCCNKKVADSIKRIFKKTLAYYTSFAIGEAAARGYVMLDFSEDEKQLGINKIKQLGLDQYGGCLNIRLKKGSTTEWSTHSWAIAVDMDPDNNKLHMSWEECRFSSPIYEAFIKFWYDEGFINLGKEYNYDGMHFQKAIGK